MTSSSNIIPKFVQVKFKGPNSNNNNLETKSSKNYKKSIVVENEISNFSPATPLKFLRLSWPVILNLWHAKTGGAWKFKYIQFRM